MPFVKLLIVIVLVSLVTGCETVAFYHQALVGQSKLMLQRRSTRSLLIDEKTDPALKYRLGLANEILHFAAEHGLPAEDAYQSYVETEQSYIIWNVFAAEPFRLELKTHCFPIAGCVSYRGFFSPDHAHRYARRLASEGLDVYVGGVRAYSTLGWFDDPLLDTFLFTEEDQLAALLFHELAHRVAYAPGDTRFNESLATAVERYLLRDWLASKGEEWRYEQYLSLASQQEAALQLIEETRGKLTAVYGAALDEASMRQRKADIIAGMIDEYQVLSREWPEPKPFGGWMNGEINNARLETVTDYNGWVPAMDRYLSGNGLNAFLEKVDELSALEEPARTSVLASW